MKPTRNKFYCFDCGRPKMLFKSQKKADNFIRFNKESFEEEGKKVPVRSYYCEACGGWHVTSNPHEEQFKYSPSEHRELTKIGRMVEIKLHKGVHDSFVIKKNILIYEAEDLYKAHDFHGSLKTCREILNFLKDYSKEWWDDIQYINKLMYDIICREASEIEACFKRNDVKAAEDIIVHCGCVMEELGNTDGFDEYRTVLSQFLGKSMDDLRKRKDEIIHCKLRKISRRINEAWGYLAMKKFGKVKTEIDRYTTELVELSRDDKNKEFLRPIVNKLFDLSLAYRKNVIVAA